MKYKLSKEESLILRLFVEREVPDFICEIVIDNINLSEHYEELFNYSIAVLDGTDEELGKRIRHRSGIRFRSAIQGRLNRTHEFTRRPRLVSIRKPVLCSAGDPQKVPACIADEPSKQADRFAKGILLRPVYPDMFEPGRSA